MYYKGLLMIKFDKLTSKSTHDDTISKFSRGTGTIVGLLELNSKQFVLVELNIIMINFAIF